MSYAYNIKKCTQYITIIYCQYLFYILNNENQILFYRHIIIIDAAHVQL